MKRTMKSFDVAEFREQRKLDRIAFRRKLLANIASVVLLASLGVLYVFIAVVFAN